MSGKSQRRKKQNKTRDKQEIKRIASASLIVGACCIAVFLGIYIPGRLNEEIPDTIMENEFVPNGDIAKSLELNEKFNAGEADRTKELVEGNLAISENSDLDKEEQLEEAKDQGDVSESSELNETDNDANDELKDVVEESDEIVNTSGDADTVANESSAIENEVALDEAVTGNEETTSKVNTADTYESTDESVVDSDLKNEETAEVAGDLAEDEQIQYVKDQWVDDMIHENRESINDGDLATGASIYNQIDTAYLFGLAEGGLTDEENAEAMEYLEANLSPEQIDLAKELYFKYIGLVD